METREKAQNELTLYTTQIQNDLDRFQRMKVQDVEGLVVAYAKTQIKYFQKNIGSWEEAYEEVNKISLDHE
jgi:hypothetical protein